MKTDKTIKELKDLVSLFLHRKLFTNDSIIMVGDICRAPAGALQISLEMRIAVMTMIESRWGL